VAFGPYQKMVVADGLVWLMGDGQTELEQWDGASIVSTVTLTHPIVDIATDGSNVYVASRNTAKSAGSVYLISQGSTTPVLLNTIIPDLVGYVMGRLMVTAGADIYNITDVGDTAPPSALTAVAINSAFVWDAIGYADNFILVSGHGGDLSLVYRITIREDGTALSSPVLCAQLPDGEYVTAIKPYLGVVVLGTTRGIRVGVIESGALQFGPLIEETEGFVSGLEPQDRYIYYGVLGAVHRLDLSRFLPGFPLVPAYASYLELGSSDQVTGLVFYDDRVHAIHGDVLEAVDESTFSSEEGQLYSGRINYQMADKKHFYYVDVVSREDHPSDNIQVYYTTDGNSWTLAGTLDNAGAEKQFLIDVEAEWVELRFDFTKGDPTSSPVLERFVIRALPLPKRTQQIQLPLDMREKFADGYGGHDLRAVYEEVEALEAMVKAGNTVAYEEFGRTFTASLENIQWGPDLDVVDDASSWEGICVVTLRIYE